MGTVYLKDVEATHKQLFDAHRKLSGGAEVIHVVATELYAASRYADGRRDLAPVIDKLEQARKLADEAWQMAGAARSDLIKLTGCSGTCSGK